MVTLSDIWEKALDFLFSILPKIISAIIIWLIGNFIINKIIDIIRKKLKKNTINPTLNMFLVSLMGWGLKLILLLVVIDQMGISITSFAALIAGGTLAVGLALQGSFSNFAGGVMIMVFKPFVLGDMIKAQDKFGKVIEIEIFYTTLRSLDNKYIIIPNGRLSNHIIENLTQSGSIWINLEIKISYEFDVKKAR